MTELTNVPMVKKTVENWINYLKDNWDEKPSNYSEMREAYKTDLHKAIGKDVIEEYEYETGFLLRPVKRYSNLIKFILFWKRETEYKIAGINQGWENCEADPILVNGEWVEDVEGNFMEGDVIMRMGNSAFFNDGEYPEWYEKEHMEKNGYAMTMYEIDLEY
jgi:hypothetical protein